MPLDAGDKCPVCKDGLLEKTELGLSCTKCPFEMDVEEVAEAHAHAKTHAGEYEFKPRTFKMTLDDPEETQEFLEGLILAKQNNNSEYFPLLIDICNEVLVPWRAAKLEQEMTARGQ